MGRSMISESLTLLRYYLYQTLSPRVCLELVQKKRPSRGGFLPLTALELTSPLAASSHDSFSSTRRLGGAYHADAQDENLNVRYLQD